MSQVEMSGFQSTGASICKATGLSIYQGQSIILDAVTFEIARGEFVFLIGRTGSGKSSLLKTIYADLPLVSGLLDVAGVTVAPKMSAVDISRLRSRLGIIFQDFQLLSDRTVADNLSFVLRALGWADKAKIKSRIADVVVQVGLGNMMAKLPHQLSGGEQQRVAVARALLNEPVLIVADEPTGNLDPEVGFAILEVFKDLNRRGTAILMATHNHTFLRDYQTRILKCEDGRLIDSAQEPVTFIR